MVRLERIGMERTAALSPGGTSVPSLFSKIYICGIICTPIASIECGKTEKNLHGKPYKDAQHDN